jgi:hypothetical protein
MVESGFESSKRVRPLGSKSDQKQKVDSNKKFGEEDVKDEVVDTSNDNLEEEKIGKQVIFPKTLPLVESVSFDDQIVVVKNLFLLKILSFLWFPYYENLCVPFLLFNFSFPMFLGVFCILFFTPDNFKFCK